MKTKAFLSPFNITITGIIVICLALILINTRVINQATVKMKKKISLEITNNEQEIQQAETIAVLTRYEVKEEYSEKFRNMLSEYVAQACSNEDNIMAEAYYEQEHPSVCWIIERWSNQKVLNKNNNSRQFKAIRALAAEALLQPAKIIYLKDLEPLSKDEWRRMPKKDDKPITIMLFVDSKAGTEDNFIKIYHKAMPQFRSEAGVINYQLSQLEDDITQFVTYEKFRNEDAFQYHLKFPPIQPVIDYLNTSIKSQPFQTGLHRLVRFAPIMNDQ